MKVKDIFVLLGLMAGVLPFLVGMIRFVETWNPIWAIIGVIGIPLMLIFPHYLDRREHAASQK